MPAPASTLRPPSPLTAGSVSSVQLPAWRPVADFMAAARAEYAAPRAVRRVLEALPTPAGLFFPDGRVAYLNPALQRRLGQVGHAWHGRPLATLTPLLPDQAWPPPPGAGTTVRLRPVGNEPADLLRLDPPDAQAETETLLGFLHTDPAPTPAPGPSSPPSTRATLRILLRDVQRVAEQLTVDLARMARQPQAEAALRHLETLHLRTCTLLQIIETLYRSPSVSSGGGS
ncbi:MAG: hypothetical protein AAGI71_04690 [Bacteroidota bacterium]